MSWAFQWLSFKAWWGLNWMKVILVGALAWLMVIQFQSCRDKKDDAEVVRLTEEKRVKDSIITATEAKLAVTSQQLDIANAKGAQTIEHWNTVKVPVPLPANATPHDTIAAFARRLNACYEAGDSLVQSIVKIQSACSAFRDTARKVIDAQKGAIATRDTLIDVLRRGKRVQWYGEALYEIPAKRPVFRVGNQTRLFWHVDGKFEGQYAVPAAKDTLAKPQDGFSLFAGVHASFR